MKHAISEILYYSEHTEKIIYGWVGEKWSSYIERRETQNQNQNCFEVTKHLHHYRSRDISYCMYAFKVAGKAICMYQYGKWRHSPGR